MHRFNGVYTALITPFTDIGTVDYQALERIVNEQWNRWSCSVRNYR